MKKFISLVLSVTMILTLLTPVYAASGRIVNNGEVKVAYVENLNSDGSNVGNDQTNESYELPEGEYNISFSLDFSTLSLNGNIKERSFEVTGAIVTTNENRNLLLYEASDSSGNYDVAYLSVDRKLDETALFFAEFYATNPQYVGAIKLYLQPVGTNSLVLIEIFFETDFVATLLNSQSILYDSDKANEIQCWFVRYYGPIIDENDTDEAQILPMYHIGADPLDLSETYYLNGVRITIHFVVDLYYTFSDLGQGGATTAELCFRVTESRISSDVPSNNSSTQSYLQLRDLNIKVSAMPYIIFTSQDPYRDKVQNTFGTISTGFSVYIGIASGVFSASGSLSLTKSDLEMKSSAVSLPHGDEKGVKGTECGQLPSSYYLNKTDSYYGFRLTYRHMGNTSFTSYMNIEFEYSVYNQYNYTDSYSKTVYKTASVTVG